MAAANVRINPIGVGVLVLVSSGIVVYMTGLPSWMSSATKNEVNIRELLSASIDLAQVISFFNDRFHFLVDLDLDSRFTKNKVLFFTM